MPTAIIPNIEIIIPKQPKDMIKLITAFIKLNTNLKGNNNKENIYHLN